MPVMLRICGFCLYYLCSQVVDARDDNDDDEEMPNRIGRLKVNKSVVV